MKKRLKEIYGWTTANLTSIFWLLAMVCFFVSFLEISPASPGRRADKVERMLHKREKVLQAYVDRAFDVPKDEWVRFEHFPEDMVLYKYVNGTLQSAPQNMGAPAVARIYIKKHLKRVPQMLCGALIKFLPRNRKKRPKANAAFRRCETRLTLIASGNF